MDARFAIGEKLEWNSSVEKKFNELFDSIDTDQNGKLTFDEVKEKVLTRVLRRIGENPTDSEIKLYLDGIDKDGDGAVSKDEFRTWIKELLVILQDPKKSLVHAVEVMFKACDVDKNGLISKSEFSNFMKKMGRPLKDNELDQLFRAVDVDGDTSSLTKEELLSILFIGRASRQIQRLQ